MSEYYSIITTKGASKLINAQIKGEAIKLTHFAIGDGDGANYEPDKSQTTLKGEQYKAEIQYMKQDKDNPAWLIIEAIIPITIGGFMIREVGIFDQDGDLFAIGKYPETFKPKLQEGTGTDIMIKMILEVGSTDNITIQIDPSAFLATQKYVEEKFEGKVAINNNDTSQSSILLQKDKSARVELGLNSDDDLIAMVSPDGSNWNDAIKIDKDTGHTSFNNGATIKHSDGRIDRLERAIATYRLPFYYPVSGAHTHNLFDVWRVHTSWGDTPTCFIWAYTVYPFVGYGKYYWDGHSDHLEVIEKINYVPKFSIIDHGVQVEKGWVHGKSFDTRRYTMQVTIASYKWLNIFVQPIGRGQRSRLHDNRVFGYDEPGTEEASFGNYSSAVVFKTLTNKQVQR